MRHLFTLSVSFIFLSLSANAALQRSNPSGQYMNNYTMTRTADGGYLVTMQQGFQRIFVNIDGEPVALKWIQEGFMDSCVSQDPIAYGEIAVEMLGKYAMKGQPVPIGLVMDEFCGCQLRLIGPDRPVRVVKIQCRIGGQQIDVGFPVRINVANVAPVVLVPRLLVIYVHAAALERMRHRAAGLHRAWNDVSGKIMA